MIYFRLFFLFLIASTSWAQYPESWWKPVDESRRHSWEILPQDAGPGEVILSKRNELGILSNFAPTPFILDGISYASIEGLWQSMKYPDPRLKMDPRRQWQMPFTRQQVATMSGFEAKDAGSVAGRMMKEKRYPFVSYRGKRFNYKDFAEGSQYHYQLIYRATWEKVKSNPEAKRILLMTKGLTLRPDHTVEGKVPPSYRYYDILMDIRDRL